MDLLDRAKADFEGLKSPVDGLLDAWDIYKEYKWTQDPKNADKDIFDYRLNLDAGRNNTKNFLFWWTLTSVSVQYDIRQYFKAALRSGSHELFHHFI